MGLSEKRAVKDFQDSVYPKLKQDIDKAAGFEVPITVEWDTLAVDGAADYLKDAIGKIYFIPLQKALESICQDDMGKEALKGALKKVVIKNASSIYGVSGFSFDGGTLTLDHLSNTNVDDVKVRTDGIVALLEAKL